MRGQLWRSFARMWQGFELVAASRYLCHLCLYIVLSTTISSFLFFEKSMVSTCVHCCSMSAVIMCSICLFWHLESLNER